MRISDWSSDVCSSDLEWLEIPWQIDILLAVAGAFLVVPLLATAARRDVDHIYVTGWYYLAALCWFPILFAIANIPSIHSGAQEIGRATSELQSLLRISYAVFCLKKNK